MLKKITLGLTAAMAMSYSLSTQAYTPEVVETSFYRFEVPYGATTNYVSEDNYWKAVNYLKRNIMTVVPEGFPIPPELMVNLTNFISPIVRIKQDEVTSYAFSILPPVPGGSRDQLIAKFFTPDVIGKSASKNQYLKVRLHKEAGSGNSVIILLSVGEEYALRTPEMDQLSESFEARTPTQDKLWQCIFNPVACR